MQIMFVTFYSVGSFPALLIELAPTNYLACNDVIKVIRGDSNIKCLTSSFSSKLISLSELCMINSILLCSRPRPFYS